MNLVPQGCYGWFLYDSGWQLPVLVADLAFFGAYLAISVRLLALQRHMKRIGVQPWVLPAFSAFIFLCGSYHLAVAAGTVWIVDALRVTVTMLGAAVSVGVAIFFWRFVTRIGKAIDGYVSGATGTEQAARRTSLLVERAELLRDDVNDLRAIAAAAGVRDVF